MQGEAAKLLSERRHALGLTQHQVAQLAGVREYDVSRWERGKTRALPLLGIWKISRALEIPLQDVAKAMEADEQREVAERAHATPANASAPSAGTAAA